MEPTTAAMIAKAAIAVGTNKKAWTGIASVLVGICIPFILAIVCILNLASAAADHNRAAVRLAFHGGFVPISMPADYKEYIYKMQQSFGQIDAAMDEIDAVAEGDVQDRYLVKAVFYSLYFGEDWFWLTEADYKRFAESFVNFEERTRTVTEEDGTEKVETYQASIAITDKVELFERIKSHYGVAATYEQQSNAVNVWHLAKYNTTAPMEGDGFDDWSNWNGGGDVTYYDLPASEVGGKVVELAMSRLGHPYSQTYRGKGDYTDCSYLTMWCYRQVGITIPGTAAEQGRYLVENNLTIAKEDLQPGDLVFWSYKPNGRFMNITHVGVYAGEGMVVDASYSKGKVVYRNLFDSDKQVLYGRPQ
ncbi:peptidoglycan endopeptidase [Eisenbergiella tayi]|uniref:Peptidoglycan endopeptidase n=1 Tax=Eisenbergiella porci TaxID=2652274 RepID=A0A6N7WPL0_9FIRM|nr:NlpC/P60 family protein [Eisenbergiella porci]MSS91330.1 peptidoglycan endopeptidase [Eisenbergiella porci]